jgi:hypothetical protein
MSSILDGKKCEFCRKKAVNAVFARFVCASEGCVNKAYEERGGPAGHRKRKKS